jgi:hypothetical protein
MTKMKMNEESSKHDNGDGTQWTWGNVWIFFINLIVYTTHTHLVFLHRGG